MCTYFNCKKIGILFETSGICCIGYQEQKRNFPPSSKYTSGNKCLWRNFLIRRLHSCLNRFACYLSQNIFNYSANSFPLFQLCSLSLTLNISVTIICHRVYRFFLVLRRPALSRARLHADIISTCLVSPCHLSNVALKGNLIFF